MLNLVIFFAHSFAAQLFLADTVCLICLDNPVTTLFRPCGHFCACDACAVQVKEMTCPMCRAEVSGTMSAEPMGLHDDKVSAILWCKAFYQQCIPDAYKYRPNHQEDFSNYLKWLKQNDWFMKPTSKKEYKFMSMFKYYLQYEAVETIKKLEINGRNVRPMKAVGVWVDSVLDAALDAYKKKREIDLAQIERQTAIHLHDDSFSELKTEFESYKKEIIDEMLDWK